jgi:Mg2+/citrate symporter
VGVYTAVVTATNSVSSDTATTMVVVTEANFPVYIPVVIKD